MTDLKSVADAIKLKLEKTFPTFNRLYWLGDITQATQRPRYDRHFVAYYYQSRNLSLANYVIAAAQLKNKALRAIFKFNSVQISRSLILMVVS